MQSFLSRIWTRVSVSISYDDNHYTTGTSIKKNLFNCQFFFFFPRPKNSNLFIFYHFYFIFSFLSFYLNEWDPSTATAMEEMCGLQEGLLKNKPHLVTCYENILVSLWTFQSALNFRNKTTPRFIWTMVFTMDSFLMYSTIAGLWNMPTASLQWG